MGGFSKFFGLASILFFSFSKGYGQEYQSPYFSQLGSFHKIEIIKTKDNLAKYLALIESAQENISIDTSRFTQDFRTRAILSALISKMRKMEKMSYVRDSGQKMVGYFNPDTQKIFEVRLLIDASVMKDGGINSFVADFLKKEGIQVRSYSRSSVQNRRNLFISDNWACIEGVTDTVCTQGPIVAQIMKSYFAFWVPNVSYLTGFSQEIQSQQESDIVIPEGGDRRHYLEALKHFRKVQESSLNFLFSENSFGLTNFLSTVRSQLTPLQTKNYVTNKIDFISDRPGTRGSEFLTSEAPLLNNDLVCINSTDPKGLALGNIEKAGLCFSEQSQKLSDKETDQGIQTIYDAGLIDQGKTVLSIQKEFNFTVLNPECISDPEDLFEPAKKIPVLKNVCLETKEFRAPFVLRESSDSIVVANFRHGRGWWIATIPKDGIADVFVQVSTFKTKGKNITDIAMKLSRAAHVDLRFRMKPNFPVILRSQDRNNSETQTIDSFTLSPQPVQDGEIMVDGLVSTLERGLEDIGYGWKTEVDQYEIRASENQKRDFLSSAIRRGEKMATYNFYKGLLNNCAVEVITILAESFRPGEPVPDVTVNLTHLFSPFNVINGQITRALSQLKLIDSKTLRYEMEEEDPSGISYLNAFKNIDLNLQEKSILSQKIKVERAP